MKDVFMIILLIITFWSETLKGTDHSEDVRRDWEENIRLNLWKFLSIKIPVHEISMDCRIIGWEAVDWMHLAQDRDHLAGCCDHSNEPPCFIKGWEFLDHLSDYYLLKKDFVRWN
jgi:hypothetical protein